MSDSTVLIVFIVLNLLLMAVIGWQSRKLDDTHDEMHEVLENIQEIINVVNSNADIQKSLTAEFGLLKNKIDWVIPILDSHAHALKIYSPLLSKLDSSLSLEIEE